MQSSNAPNKFLVPFAQNDSAKVEIPVTTVDATRASQSLGFPPLTMQPPEVGGVPPQGEDFNGAMNQVARSAWWLMLGSMFVYDMAFATNTNIGGYPKGSQLLRADLAGLWLNGTENNVTNPDDNTGAAAGWLPGYTYGAATIAVSTATTVNPVNAAHKTLLLTGTLTANSVVNLPAWIYDWSIVDNTVRAGFTLTVKTASGTGVTIASGAQKLQGDGTNIVQLAETIAAAGSSAQSAQAGQVASGALLTATAAGTANAITAAFPFSPASYSAGQPFTIIANATNTGAMTAVLTLGGTAQASVPIVKGNNLPVVAGDFPAGYPGDFNYSPSFAAIVMANPATGVGSSAPSTFMSVNASVAASALPGTLTAPGLVPFRNPTLSNGAVVTASVASNLSLIVPSGATLGTVAAVSARLIWLLLYNAGTPVLGVVNLSGGNNLDETTLISSTAISAGATAANVVYTTAAVTNSPFRVVGFTDATEATPGTWATAPTKNQGIGGQAIANMGSFGFGQTWQDLTASRAFATTYYNTTGKAIDIIIVFENTGNSLLTATVNGYAMLFGTSANVAGNSGVGKITIPANASYNITSNTGNVITQWSELR